MKLTKKNKPKVKRHRLFVVYFALTLIYIALFGKITYIILFNGKQYKSLADNQWFKTVSLPAKRGDIFDSSGRVLAVSSDVYRVDADIKTLNGSLSRNKIGLSDFNDEFSRILDVKKGAMLKLLTKRNSKNELVSFTGIKRKVDKDTIDKIKALVKDNGVLGIIISQDSERYYPNNSFLSSVLGSTNQQGNGISGVELTYNNILSGKDGVEVIESDRHKNNLPYTSNQEVPAINGKNITLTIDNRIQYIVETVAKETLRKTGAKNVNIIVANPKNGEILAMTSKPDYNLNDPSGNGKTISQLQNIWKTKSVSDVFEPGSIFKAITAAAALESNLDTSKLRFVCNGTIKVGGEVLHCDDNKAHGIETFSDIIKNSCNVGFVELSKKLGKNQIFSFAKNAGFGKKTGIDLPGESSGIIKDQDSARQIDTATMSYGQGIAVTQVQYIAAFNAIANGGTWITPHVMKNIGHYNNNEKNVIDKSYDNYDRKTIMSPENTKKLRKYLRRVVKEGTAKATIIKGIPVAGKTGTARKVDAKTGGYKNHTYISSFAGMAPYNDPKITLIVSVDEPNPKTYYASQTAVPAAKKLFIQISKYINLK
ncbi:peptidoglycan D,D-transpeptidase FtsI family protein [Clostridium oryzae]|uniref:Stage V sporulation protein D n=1 Tax=Clostridium oryzae TaxID=1450648 RepID=A0A1V4IR70_9CLOT|nr:penicillin-binding transpeptidase domain-containing protein [Clostridium oryzae]OPJ62413.1 stage V sporulation protein D [Clostridium oryzae]